MIDSHGCQSGCGLNKVMFWYLSAGSEKNHKTPLGEYSLSPSLELDQEPPEKKNVRHVAS
jgi:hypothetical protein